MLVNLIDLYTAYKMDRLQIIEKGSLRRLIEIKHPNWEVIYFCQTARLRSRDRFFWRNLFSGPECVHVAIVRLPNYIISTQSRASGGSSAQLLVGWKRVIVIPGVYEIQYRSVTQYHPFTCKVKINIFALTFILL